jgi:hypothetical protein
MIVRYMVYLYCNVVFNATYHNISVISWQSVLLLGETEVTSEYHRPVASHWQILSHIVVSRPHRHEWHCNSNRKYIWLSLYCIVMTVKYIVFNFYCNESQIYVIFVLQWQSDIWYICITMTVRYMVYLYCNNSQIYAYIYCLSKSSNQTERMGITLITSTSLFCAWHIPWPGFPIDIKNIIL